MKRIYLYMLFALLWTSCIEVRHYNRDIADAFKSKIPFEEVDKKYYDYYEKAILPPDQNSGFLNKVYINERINQITNSKEVAGIFFFLNPNGKLVFTKSEYFSSLMDVINYLKDTLHWSGYAIVEGNVIKTEYLYNYYWRLEHQIIKYNWTDNTLERTERYRKGNAFERNKEKIFYRVLE